MSVDDRTATQLLRPSFGCFCCCCCCCCSWGWRTAKTDGEDRTDALKQMPEMERSEGF
jgi:hypothetical protein